MSDEKPLLSHFLELRNVIIKSIVSVFISFVLVFYFFSETILNFIKKPIEDRGVEIIYTAVSEALLTQLKLSIVSAIIISSPVIIWQLWKFIKPALYKKEIRAVKSFFFVTLFLFLCGVAFCYTCIYGLAINFFLVAGENLAIPMLSLDKYLSFMLSFLLPFGFSFDLPVVLYITTKLGLTTPQMLVKKFKYVVLLIFVVAAFLTPPDIFSQIMLALPLLLLYGIGILVSKTVKAKSKSESMELDEPI